MKIFLLVTLRKVLILFNIISLPEVFTGGMMCTITPIFYDTFPNPFSIGKRKVKSEVMLRFPESSILIFS